MEKLGKCTCGNTEFLRTITDIITVTKTDGAYTDDFLCSDSNGDDLVCTKCGKRYTDCEGLNY